MSTRPVLCRSHPDCHMPPELDVGAGFDGDAYAGRMQASGADLAVAFAKCHYGYAYYPTRVGTVHPRLRSDLFGGTVRGLHRRGLAASAYLSVHLDGMAAQLHPEWRMQGSATTTAGFDSGHFTRLCVNSAYTEELFIPQCVEVVGQYEVDELLLDTMSGFAPCHCPVCRAAFGSAIPGGPADADWLRYARWYAGCFERFYARVTAAIHAVRRLPILWNHKWTWEAPEMPDIPAGRLVTDRIASPGHASLDGRYFGGTGMAFDYMCGRFAHGLAEWNSNTPASLALTAAEACAHGGTFWLIDRQLPDGGLEERGWQAMRETFAEVQARRPWLEGTAQVHETAVLCSLDHVLAPDRRHFPDAPARKLRSRPIEAALGFLAEHGRLGHGMPRSRLIERLDDLRLVLLPDVSYLDDALVDALLPWVGRGGRILASMPVDGPTGPLCRLAGVADEGPIDSEHLFIDGDEPLLMAKPWSRLRPLPGTVALQQLRLPLLPRYGHGVAPPGAPAGCPAATRRDHGRGSVLLVATPVFNAWWWSASPGLEALLSGWLDALLPAPLARVDHPGQVELSCQRQGDDLVLHLINRCGRTRLAGYHYPMVRFVPELRDVPLRLRSERPLDLVLQPEGTVVPTTCVDGDHSPAKTEPVAPLSSCPGRSAVAAGLRPAPHALLDRIPGRTGDPIEKCYIALIPRLQRWQVVVSRSHFAS